MFSPRRVYAIIAIAAAYSATPATSLPSSETPQARNVDASAASSSPQKRQITYTNYGGNSGFGTGAFDAHHYGDNVSNDLKNVGTVSDSFTQGSGKFVTGSDNNAAESVFDTFFKPNEMHEAIAGGFGKRESDSSTEAASGSNAVNQTVTTTDGDTYTQTFKGVENVHGGFVHGPGDHQTANNAAPSNSESTDST